MCLSALNTVSDVLILYWTDQLIIDGHVKPEMAHLHCTFAVILELNRKCLFLLKIRGLPVEVQ